MRALAVEIPADVRGTDRISTALSYDEIPNIFLIPMQSISLNARAMEAIRHLKAQRIVGCPFVFATQTGKLLGYRNQQAMMEKACEVAGVDLPRPACTATLLLQ